MKKRKIFSGDRVLFFIPLGLSIFGLLSVLNASSATALETFNDKYYFFNKQALFFVLGLISFFFFSFFDYKRLKKFALPFFFFNLLLLIIVLIPGIGRQVYGGRRWLPLGVFGFQPAETTKLAMIIYLSSLLEKKKHLTTFLGIIGLVLILVMLEPDMGTAGIITITAVCLFFLAETPLKDVLAVIGLGLVSVPMLILTSSYRKKRFLEFLSSSLDKEKTSYHVKQILISLGSGGFWGRGFGQSRQKYSFLPEAATDSIFAVIAEEFGFLGASFLIFIFIFFIIRGFNMSLEVKDFFGRMLSLGIIFMIGIQAIINFSSMVALTPLTGVPLPFISYGGSSLLVSFSATGILYNISRQLKKIK